MKLGKYDLLEVLGKGSMGTVYRAKDRDSGAFVAVKLMPSEVRDSQVLLQRFKQEYAAASRLSHPNIVRALGVGEEDGKPYLVMELVEGCSLVRQVWRHGPVSVPDGTTLARQLAGALDLAHEHQLIHRDVKPENVLIDRDGQAKLTDLGLVKDLSSEDALTTSGACLGTIVYMAPEQFSDARHVDATCDIYGLGATLYYALTGVAPFQGGNLTVLGKKLKGEFRPPSRLVRSLPKCYDDAIAAALAPEPSRRPRSCRDLVAMLPSYPDDSESAPAAPDVPDAPTPDERRRATRYPTRRAASCRPMQSGPRRWVGEVLDVSRTGVQLKIDRRFERGAVLELEVSDNDTGASSTFLVRISWAREISKCEWALGCAFSSTLEVGDLAVFLGESAGTVAIHAKR